MRSWLLVDTGALRWTLRQRAEYLRYTTVGKTVCDGEYSIPMIASRWLGIMFQLTGTAATQYRRTAADADGAATSAAAPIASAATRVAARFTAR